LRGLAKVLPREMELKMGLKPDLGMKLWTELELGMKPELGIKPEERERNLRVQPLQKWRN